MSGVALPPGLIEGSRLPEPIFTPTTKVAPGEGHDEFMTYADVEAQVGADVAAELQRITLEVYRRGPAVAARAASSSPTPRWSWDRRWGAQAR